MIGALVKRYWVQIVVVALIALMALIMRHYRQSALEYRDQRDKATVRAEASEAITNNVITTMNLIRDISQATQNAKNELELNAQLYTALGQCNLDKAGIRSIEERRNAVQSADK